MALANGAPNGDPQEPEWIRKLKSFLAWIALVMGVLVTSVTFLKLIRDQAQDVFTVAFIALSGAVLAVMITTVRSFWNRLPPNASQRQLPTQTPSGEIGSDNIATTDGSEDRNPVQGEASMPTSVESEVTKSSDRRTFLYYARNLLIPVILIGATLTCIAIAGLVRFPVKHNRALSRTRAMNGNVLRKQAEDEQKAQNVDGARAHFQAAAAEFQRSTDYDPSYLEAYRDWGGSLMELGELDEHNGRDPLRHYEEAAKALKYVVDRDPVDARDAYNYANALRHLGENQGAIDYFQKAAHLAEAELKRKTGTPQRKALMKTLHGAALKAIDALKNYP
jgi:multisubunit Na+/H+ antiporter MnhG subunit